MLRFIFVVVACHFLLSCQKEPEDIISNAPGHMARVAFQGTVAGDSLRFGTDYFNAFHEQFNVQTFKFYLHHFQFRNISDKKYTKIKNDSYYFVDINDPSSCQVEIEVPAGYYDQLKFVMGVDSLLNVSGAQDGVLDPAKGMFWTWNYYRMFSVQSVNTLP